MVVAHEYRAMQMADLDAVMAIEEHVYDYPWTRGNFSDSLDSGYSAVTMTQHGKIIAYAVVMFVLDEAHLLNICVDTPHQGQGLGREMLMHMVDLAKQKQCANMFLEVRASNQVAIRLYEHVGFCEMSIRKAYYRHVEGREDAVLMGLVL